MNTIRHLNSLDWCPTAPIPSDHWTLGEKARSGSEEAFMAALQAQLLWLWVFQAVAVS